MIARSLLARAAAWSANALILFMVSAPASRASAQVSMDEGHTQLLGTVVDAQSGAPLQGAFVSLDFDDTGYLTHEDGSFALPVWPRGEYTVTVELLGYADLELEVSGPETDALVLQLSPDPIVLEAIEVQVDRLERRRRSVPVSVFAADRDDLLKAPSMDVVDWVEGRFGLVSVYCQGSTGAAWASSRASAMFDDIGNECVLRRGRWVKPTIYLDEMPLLGGLEMLRTYQPQDFYTVEVYDRGTHIRLYTAHFMELVAKGRRFIPLVIM